jgi:hypothetical protein
LLSNEVSARAGISHCNNNARSSRRSLLYLPLLSLAALSRWILSRPSIIYFWLAFRLTKWFSICRDSDDDARSSSSRRSLSSSAAVEPCSAREMESFKAVEPLFLVGILQRDGAFQLQFSFFSCSVGAVAPHPLSRFFKWLTPAAVCLLQLQLLSRHGRMAYSSCAPVDQLAITYFCM